MRRRTYIIDALLRLPVARGVIAPTTSLKMHHDWTPALTIRRGFSGKETSGMASKARPTPPAAEYLLTCPADWRSQSSSSSRVRPLAVTDYAAYSLHHALRIAVNRRRTGKMPIRGQISQRVVDQLLHRLCR